MRRRRTLPIATLSTALAVAALPTAARAQDTTLSLSETATVMAHPDELDGGLRAEATAPTAAEAQRLVNAAMADALARAKQVAGVTASTGGYGVYRDTSVKPERWQASQTLDLRSADGPALLTLVGALQQKGLALSDLHWQLSDETERRARAEATRKAIGTLRARADEAAALLNLSFVRFASVRLDASVQPRPLQRMMAAAMPMAAAAPPPSAEGQDVPVNATVGADVVLAPK
jgi:predicted secreted protein